MGEHWYASAHSNAFSEFGQYMHSYEQKRCHLPKQELHLGESRSIGPGQQ